MQEKAPHVTGMGSHRSSRRNAEVWCETYPGLWHLGSCPALRNPMALKHQQLLSRRHSSYFPNNLGTANKCRFLSSVTVMLCQHFSISTLQSPLDFLPKCSHPSSSNKSQTSLIVTNKIIDVRNADAGR